MAILLGWVFSIVGWIVAGIWTWSWIDPDSFGRAVVWLIVFSIASAIIRVVFAGIGAMIGSMFDNQLRY